MTLLVAEEQASGLFIGFNGLQPMRGCRWPGDRVSRTSADGPRFRSFGPCRGTQAGLPRRLAGEAYPFEPSDAVGTGQQEDDRGAACGKFLRQRRVHRGKGGERGPVNGEAYRNDDVGL